MKVASIPDWWKVVNTFNKYNAKLNKISFYNVGQFDDFELNLDSAISFLTGRNGIGKTNFLKLIYSVLSKDTEISLGHFSPEDRAGIKIFLKVRGKDIEIHDNSDIELPVPVEYFDPSAFSSYILDAISVNPDKTWNEGNEPRILSKEDIEIILKVTGKRYDSIEVTEVLPEEDRAGQAKKIPLFTVTLGDVTYMNENMGAGEHKALVLIWKLITAEESSFLLLEEPESFICPNYQAKLINFIAWYASSKKLTVIISTHSEHVMRTQRSNSSFIFQKVGKNRFKLVAGNQESRYLAALGLKANKNRLLLVEDAFAKLKLECILAELDQDLFETSTVRALSGESDIKAVTSHLSKGEHIQVIGIYDADIVGQDLGVVSKLNYLFLPDENNKAPEEAVISFVEENVEYMAAALDISYEIFEAILDEHIEDHHDWFIELGRKLNHPNLLELKQKCIKEWVNYNSNICKKFVFELKNIGKTFNSKLCIKEGLYIAETQCGLEYLVNNILTDMPEEGTRLPTEILFTKTNEKQLQLSYN